MTRFAPWHDCAERLDNQSMFTGFYFGTLVSLLRGSAGGPTARWGCRGLNRSTVAQPSITVRPQQSGNIPDVGGVKPLQEKKIILNPPVDLFFILSC